MAKRQTKDTKYAEEFETKVSAPDAAVQSIEPGMFVQLKWADAPDSVALVIDVKHVRRRKEPKYVVDNLELFDPQGGFHGEYTGSLFGAKAMEQIVHVFPALPWPQVKPVLKLVK